MIQNEVEKTQDKYGDTKITIIHYLQRVPIASSSSTSMSSKRRFSPVLGYIFICNALITSHRR